MIILLLCEPNSQSVTAVSWLCEVRTATVARFTFHDDQGRYQVDHHSDSNQTVTNSLNTVLGKKKKQQIHRHKTGTLKSPAKSPSSHLSARESRFLIEWRMVEAQSLPIWSVAPNCFGTTSVLTSTALTLTITHR